MRGATLGTLVALLLAGCAAPAGTPDVPEEWREHACQDPWPCGNGAEWPTDLATPPGGFDFPEYPTPLRIPMDDGVELDGAVWLPELPDSARPPIVIWATPYAGQCRYSGFVRASPGCDEDPAHANNFALDEFAFLLREGYAAAMVSMRGTGLSEGCFDLYGPRGQKDMADMAQWFGEQGWGNGRVAMWGVSAMGTTPFMAAIGAPPALKTIAPSGIITDLYLNRFTPQGAPDITAGSFHAGWSGFNSVVPPGGVATGRFLQDVPGAAPALASAASTRYCEGLPTTLTAGVASQHTDERDETFWAERRLVDRFGDIRAAVFVMQGFQDHGHAFQDDTFWPSIAAPKRLLAGQWPHTHVFDDALAAYPGGNATHDILIEWFDFWLKGRGTPARLGIVDHQDSAGIWREAREWPPAEARGEVLYLAGGALATAPGAPSTYRASAAAHPPGCGYGQDPPSEGALLFETPPREAPATIAGNPLALLELVSDQRGGAFALSLYDIDASGACVALIAEGGADLRFHEGNMRGRDFPVGVATPVRIDLFGAAHHLEKGHRLRAVISAGESGVVGQPQYAPTLTIGGASHLVLPLVEGTFGGEAPTAIYPPRPLTRAS